MKWKSDFSIHIRVRGALSWPVLVAGTNGGSLRHASRVLLCQGPVLSGPVIASAFPRIGKPSHILRQCAMSAALTGKRSAPDPDRSVTDPEQVFAETPFTPFNRIALSPRIAASGMAFPRLDSPHVAATAAPLIAALGPRLDPFYLCDRDGTFLGGNAGFESIVEILFGDMAAFLRDGGNTGLAGAIEPLKRGVPELRFRHRHTIDGREIEWQSHHFPIRDRTGETIGYAGIFSDVTPVAEIRKGMARLEDWLDDVIRSTVGWVWIIDANGLLTFVSPGITETLGIPCQILKGRDFFSLGNFDPHDSAAAATPLDLRHRRPFRDRIFLMRDRQGGVRHVQLCGVPVFDETSGDYAGYRGTARDISDRILAEARERQAAIRLEDAMEALQSRNEALQSALEHSRMADKAKADFLAMMSHELRTPLNCVIGFSEAAMQRIHGPLPEAYAEYFGSINASGRHLLALINDILDSANIDTGTLTITSVPVVCRDLIDEALTMVDMKAAEKHITIVPPEWADDVSVMGDPLRARQILVNLLSNALKFTPDGGRIGIDLALTDPKAPVSITVWDTGVGIGEDDKARVFDQFYKAAHDPMKPGSEGAGLGLHIARKLARLMGGDLQLESHPGRGARFTLTLPRA